MLARGYYEMAVWLPLAVAGVVALLVHGLDLRPGEPMVVKAVQVVLSGLLYAGAPYGLMAVWATRWIRRHSESEIRRLAWRAPLLILAAYLPFAFGLGVLSGRVIVGAGLAAIGATFILSIGYAYLGVILAIRRWVGGPGRAAA
jgi:hypothetical protein